MTATNHTPATDDKPKGDLVRKSEMPEWLAGPLEKYTSNPAFELMLPSVPVNSELGYGHRVAVSLVQISANPDDKEVFPVGKRGDVPLFAYSKAGLEKMAEAAGIQVKTERVDDRKNPDFCEVVAYAAMKGSSGQPLLRMARKAFNMPDVEAEAMRQKQRFNQNLSEDQLRAAVAGEMASFKKHMVARTETGAVLRVMRSLLAIKSGLTAAQISKPKVLARVEFNPDPSDPIARQFMLEKGYEAGVSLFGPPSSERPQIGAGIKDVTEEVTEEEEPESLDPGTHSLYPSAEAKENGHDAGPTPPQTQLPIGEPDYMALVFEGCVKMGIPSAERNDLMIRHKGNMKAAYLELNKRADQAAS